MKDQAKYLREWREKHPNRHKEYIRRYKERHPERVAEQRAKAKARYVSQGSGKFPYCRVSKEEQRRKATITARTWRDKNREKVREVNRKSYHRNKIKNNYGLYSRNYKSKVRAGRDGTITKRELEELLVKQNGRCTVCVELLGRDKEIDHKIPISKGGKHSIGNIQWTCRRCNRVKGNKIL